MDRRSWQIGVLGSKCLDRHSSRRAWIGDRESGSALVADRRAWIGVLLVVLGSKFQIGSVLGSECSYVNTFFNSFKSALVVVDWLNP